MFIEDKEICMVTYDCSQLFDFPKLVVKSVGAKNQTCGAEKPCLWLEASSAELEVDGPLNSLSP